MKPPLVARRPLAVLARKTEAEVVAGDLKEEFRQIAGTNGFAFSRRRYGRHAFESPLPFGVRALGDPGLPATMLACLSPILPIDRVRSFVCSNVPLKDGPNRAPGFYPVNLAVAWVCLTPRSPAAALATPGAALWMDVSAVPVWYACAVLCPIPAKIYLDRRKRA